MNGKKVVVTKKFNIKKFFKNIVNKVKKIVVLIIDKYKSLDKLYQTIIKAWTILLFVLCIFLIVLSTKSKDLSSYYEWEDYLEAQAILYAKDNDIVAPGNKPLIISDDALAIENYIDKDAPSNTCLSYVKVYFSYDNDSETGAGEYKSEAYINCKKYTTLGYSENKK